MNVAESSRMRIHRWLLPVFLALFVLASALGVYEFFYHLPRLKVWLHIDPSYTKEETAVLERLGSSHTIAEYQKLYLQAQKIAHKRPSYVEIGSCKLDPAIIRVPLESVVRFYNDDSIPHSLRFENTSFLVSERSFKDIRLDMFQHLPALYWYYCDDMATPVWGVFIDKPLIIPEPT